MAKCWRQNEEHTETERHVRANDPDFNAQFKYANNFIKTSKYSLATFVPQNLFEQFQRLANFYFLCLLVLQLIPQISSLTPLTTAVPLALVLAVTALKDAIDDIQRHRSDGQVNNRLSLVFRGGQFVDERWYKVQVGDIVRMENDQFVAADLILLSTSEPNGLCYIETAELDGETNLKCRQALPETAEMGEDNALFTKFMGDVICEPPNNNLSKFEGTLRWEGETYPLDNDKVLYRGCVLRNTRWCYGIVIFAGRDTKLMQNSGKTIFKRTSLDKLLNIIIIGIVFFLMSLCLFCTVACGVWETVTGQYFRLYLPWDPLAPKNSEAGGATVTALLVFFSYGIVMNTVVPISLYVSVEVIRFFHSLLINWDEKMYYAHNDTPAKARTTTLNEELGQIEYVFSDKTGTLTQNIMTFNKCSINGKHYGDLLDENTGEPIVINENTKPIDFSFNPMHEEKFRFYDKSLIEDIRNGDPSVFEFFRLLALCHTVMSEEKPGGILEYQAQSPDEEALTSAARNFGFVFRNRTPSSVVIEVMGHRETYDLYCILDFNNVRKRMSVILRKDGVLKLYCKGADSVIFERLDESCHELKLKTLDHLNKYAGEGLRTLCLAVKELDEETFEEWKEKFHAAATSMEDREDKVNAVYEEIEKNLILLGATAIEDKLQDGVPDAIANLAMADIKLWVLTGDKQETAINIGYSCRLLSDEMVDMFTVDAFEYADVENQLRQFKESIANVLAHSQGTTSCSVVRFHNDLNAVESPVDPTGGFALVVNGHSLVHALEASMELLFLEVACQCKAVICCRVTPLQKALVVDLVKRHKGAVTLAIGDGANDVSMIKMAHIGVGISGQEGMQAVLASDFSLAQFRYLERLLLVHGRWSYFRMSKFLRYFFYKNFAFTLCHFWFGFFCGFSAQTVYDPNFISCYNVFYTSMPVLALGIFDQDVNDRNSLNYPQLYTPGHKNLLFNKKEFLKSLAHGVCTSFTLFFIPYGSFYSNVDAHGLNMDGHRLFGTVVSTLLVLVVTSQKEFLKSLAHGVCTSFTLFFIPYGSFYSNVDAHGLNMDGHRLFGTVVSTLLVLVVTSQKEFLKSLAHGVCTSFTLFFIPYGSFYSNVDAHGLNMDGHRLFGTVVSTLLVLVVTSQKEFLKSLAHGVCTSFTLFFIPYGSFYSNVDAHGLNMDGHRLFGTVVSTLLVLVVTSQKEFLKSLAHGVCTSFTLFFIPYGSFYSNVDAHGLNMDGHRLFGTVVSTLLVLVVTSQKEFLKSLAHGVCTSFTLFFIPYGSFYSNVDAHGLNMDGHRLFGTVVSTLLVLVVTSQKEFLKSLAHGVCTSFTLFFIPYGSFYSNVDAHGLNMDGHRLFGTVVSTLLVLVVTSQVALDTSYWTVFNHIVIFGSVAFFFSLTLLINSDFITSSKYLGTFRMALSLPTFWITAMLVFAILLIPVIAVRFYFVHVHPTLSDRVRLKQRRIRIKAEPSQPQIMPQLMRRPSRRKSMRSGYAFAHQEGFGRLIMSGKIMKKSKSSVSNNMLPPLLPGNITSYRQTIRV